MRVQPVTPAASIGAALCILAACQSVEPVPPPPPPAPPGIPAGNPVSADIGPSGGTIATPDGRFELVIPTGTLSATTKLTIRPLVNTAPNGVGLEYAIEPANLKRAKPITVRMTVDTASLNGETPDGLGVGQTNSAGQWVANLSSQLQDTVAASPSADPGSGSVAVAADIDDDLPALPLTALVTLWKVNPKHPTLATGQHITIEVLACVDEVSTATASHPVLRETCGASIREGTWSVNGSPDGNVFVGTVVPLSPTSTARYTAPLQPPLGPVVVVASMFWRERGLTAGLKIPVTVSGSNDWTGTLEYTREGDTSYVDPNGTSTSKKWSGKGSITVHGRVYLGSGRLSAASIVATGTYHELVRYPPSKPDKSGCVQTLEYEERFSGTEKTFPEPSSLEGSIGLELTQYAYLLDFYPPYVEIPGVLVDRTILSCPGAPDIVAEQTTASTRFAAMDPTEQTFFGTIDPAHPGHLTDSRSWGESGQSWVKVAFKWDLKRP